jgi:hypothetical protein
MLATKARSRGEASGDSWTADVTDPWPGILAIFNNVAPGREAEFERRAPDGIISTLAWERLAARCINKESWSDQAILRNRRSSGTEAEDSTAASCPGGTHGWQALELGVPDMNRIMRLNADPGGSNNGPASESSASHATQSSWLGSRLGPGDAGILAAFAASFSALIVIWGVALGYIRF